MHKRIGPELPSRVSPATQAGKHVFATNLSTDLATGAFVDGPISVQALQTFRNLVAFVEEAPADRRATSRRSRSIWWMPRTSRT